MSDILYLKTERNSQVDHIDVRLGDVAKLECVNSSIKNRLKTMKLLKIQYGGLLTNIKMITNLVQKKLGLI